MYCYRMSLQDRISDNVRALCAAQGTTPSALSREAGIITSSLHSKLQGRVRWNVEDLETLADALDVTPERRAVYGA